jgi:hypothetical protein
MRAFYECLFHPILLVYLSRIFDQSVFAGWLVSDLGDDVNRLRPKLERLLETPAALAEDAPEFAVYVSLSTGDRTAYTAASKFIHYYNT